MRRPPRARRLPCGHRHGLDAGSTKEERAQRLARPELDHAVGALASGAMLSSQRTGAVTWPARRSTIAPASASSSHRSIAGHRVAPVARHDVLLSTAAAQPLRRRLHPE